MASTPTRDLPGEVLTATRKSRAPWLVRLRPGLSG